MLNDIKHYILLKNIDTIIKSKNYELALEKLNYLIKQDFRLKESYIKRGQLCKKLLMYEDAYSDFTYIIAHFPDNINAYYERLFLNFETSNFPEVISDANIILATNPEEFDIKKLKFLAMVYSSKNNDAIEYLKSLFNSDKYKILHFLFEETAKCMTKDELAKALTLLTIVDEFDKDNPIKLLNEANIYAAAGDQQKQTELLKKINIIFPKYFISRFKFSDMYEERNMAEIYFLLDLRIFDKQNLFAYPFLILDGYKNYAEGKIIETRECFERAIKVNPNKPEAYVYLGEVLQIMSGFNNPEFIKLAEENYKIALDIYEKENVLTKAENMKRQLKHLNSSITV